MEDLVSESTCRGVIGQSKTDELPPPAALSVDSSCRSCLKSIKRWVPLDYKHEMVQLLKLAAPVVRLCLAEAADKILPCMNIFCMNKSKGTKVLQFECESY